MKTAVWLWSALAVLFVVGGAISLVVAPDSQFGGILVFSATLLIAVVISVVLHELGHAGAAVLTGFHVFHVRVGEGPQVVGFSLGGTLYELRLAPLGGATSAATTSTRGYRWRYLLVIAGGPIMTALLVLGALVWQPAPDGPWVVFRNALLFLNMVNLVMDLWPRTNARGDTQPLTDGAQILRTLRMDQADVHRVVDAYGDVEFYLELRRHGLEAAVALSNDRHDETADSPSARRRRSEVELLTGNFAEARRLIQQRFETDDIDGEERPILLNNLAWADVMLYEPALLAQADEASQQAHAELGHNPAVRGTRGSVLVALGRPGEGVLLLLDSLGAVIEPRDRALTHGWIALGYLGQSNLFDARSEVSKARQADADCVLLPRLMVDLGRAEAAHLLAVVVGADRQLVEPRVRGLAQAAGTRVPRIAEAIEAFLSSDRSDAEKADAVRPGGEWSDVDVLGTLRHAVAVLRASATTH